MLDTKIRRKLENIRELPTIPHIISQILSSLENKDIPAATLGRLVERDQTLTARVLRAANSPFYGFSRRISTIDLAIVVLGLDSIKEIVLSLVIQRFFSKVRKDVFDIRAFWEYSLFCGAGSRVMARKMGYRLAGEAFVAGLMHDIGILILMEFFTKDFVKVIEKQKSNPQTLKDAEQHLLGTDHCEIGSWLAGKWNLPARLCDAIDYHHKTFAELADEEDTDENSEEIKQPLTAIVALSEWFAMEMNYKAWSHEIEQPALYLANEVLEDIQSDDLLQPDSAVELLKQEILDEFDRASVFSKLPATKVYK